MFQNCSDFNGNISSWALGTALDMTIDMTAMFSNATNFNQDISVWNVVQVTNISYMLNYTAFDYSLADWDMSNVMTAENMLTACAMSTSNYDNTLIGWSQQTLQNAVPLHAFPLKYCDGEAARNQIINDFGWIITGDALDCGSADLLSFDNQDVQLFPNPAISNLVVELKNPEWIQLLNIHGAVLLQRAVNGTHVLPVSELESGVYFVQTASGTIKKFVKH
jgi:hypothetical protein